MTNLLSSADGFNEAQKRQLNAMLISETHRFRNKTKVEEVKVTVGTAVAEASLAVTGVQSYSYLGALFQVFYVHADSLIKYKRTKLLTLVDNIQGLQLTGNSTIPAISSGEFGIYFDVEIDGKDIYVTKLFDTNKQFKVVMFAILGDGSIK